jgi:hypothetical protein
MPKAGDGGKISHPVAHGKPLALLLTKRAKRHEHQNRRIPSARHCHPQPQPANLPAVNTIVCIS